MVKQKRIIVRNIYVLKSPIKLPDSGPRLLGLGFGIFEIPKCPSIFYYELGLPTAIGVARGGAKGAMPTPPNFETYMWIAKFLKRCSTRSS